MIIVITVCERDFWLWLAIANHMSRARILTGTIFQQYFTLQQYPSGWYFNNISTWYNINQDDISTLFQSGTISTKTTSQQYFIVQRTIFQQYCTVHQYPQGQYSNNTSLLYNNIHCDDNSTIFHSGTKSTRTIFQKASAPATNQEQQSTDLAFGKIQVPRRNRFSWTYVHTQISMVKLSRSKIYPYHGLC